MAGTHRYRLIAGLRASLGRGGRARTPVATTPGCTIGFADGPTGIAHRVTPDAFAAGRRAGGCYVALRGARVLPASLTTPARYHCPTCERSTC
ncbi:MAG: hypothetical protein ACRDRS_25480 [Pseudonocardiaceae bacterium]